MRVIDTHTHLFVKEFEEDRDDMVNRAINLGIDKLLLPCVDERSIPPMLAMCSRYNGVCYPMLGLHPTEVDESYISRLSRMEQFLFAPDSPFIAIGEVGIDLYWDTKYKKQQIEALEIQISWAITHSLSLVIHTRNAFEPLYEVISTHRDKKLSGVFHCFAGTVAEAEKLLQFEGFVLGIGGVLTYNKSTLPQVLENIPLSRVVLETDSPYLPPVPYRGKRNESAYILHTLAKIAEIYECDIEYAAKITTENAMRIFTKI